MRSFHWGFGTVLLSLLVLLVSTTPTLAQTKGYVGLMAGFSVPNYENTSSRLSYSVVGGARLDSELGFGAYHLTSSKKEDVDGANGDFSYSLFGISGFFQFADMAEGVYIGVRVGTTKLKIGNSSSTFSPAHYGLVFGYDRPLNKYFSLGGEGSWISVNPAESSGVKKEGFHILNFNFAGKFWF